MPSTLYICSKSWQYNVGPAKEAVKELVIAYPHIATSLLIFQVKVN